MEYRITLQSAYCLDASERNRPSEKATLQEGKSKNVWKITLNTIKELEQLMEETGCDLLF